MKSAELKEHLESVHPENAFKMWFFLCVEGSIQKR
jgi:hypothetical protein